MEHSVDFGAVLLAFAAALFGAKLFGELAERVGQPAVLGELLAGILLGPSVLGLVPLSDAIFVLAEIGVVLLLFEVGLETNLEDLVRVGAPALAVALAGMLLPFAGGYLVSRALGYETLTATFVGAALTATSIGITARVLSELKVLATREGQIILGAAVADDVLGLVILAVVSKVAGRRADRRRDGREVDRPRDRVSRRRDRRRDSARPRPRPRGRQVERARDARRRLRGLCALRRLGGQEGGFGPDRRSLRRGDGARADQPAPRHRARPEARRGHLRPRVLRLRRHGSGREAAQSRSSRRTGRRCCSACC